MKKMKKILLPLLSLLFVVGAGTALVSCTEEENSSLSGSGSGDTSEELQVHTHVYGEWGVTKEATCEEEGERQRTCIDDDDTQTETIPALGHDWDTANIVWTWRGYQSATVTVTCKHDGTHKTEITATVTSEVTKKATTEQAGKRTYKAEVTLDGVSYTDTTVEEIPKLIPATEGLEYTLNDDEKSYSVTGIGTATATMIGIASTYNGLPVTAIGSRAFWECSNLTIVTIPNSVTTIEYGAFAECSSLESITIPESINTIESYAFYYCSSLESITIPDSVTTIGEGAFAGCSSLESIIVEAGNTVYHSAGNCLIETASKNLIAGCKNSIIPADGSVTSIGGRAFYNCSRLESVTIPKSVTTIGDYAFSQCSRLESIIIPESVTTIRDGAFAGCSGLKSITISNSVTSIDRYAFNGCNSLTSVTFENVSDWCVSTSSTATSGTNIASEDLSDPATAAEYLTSTYCRYYWKRS